MSEITLPCQFTDSYSPGTLVTSGEGMAVRKKVWDEIVEVLVAHAPEISQITSGGV